MSAKYLLMSPKGYHDFPVNRGGSGGKYENAQEEQEERKNVFQVIYDQLTNGAEQFFGSAVKGPFAAVGDYLADQDEPVDSPSGAAKPITYSNWSPAASYFGMDQETAYTEHMVNTAHQREVADLKAAGLNPVLGVSGSGSASVSGSMSGASSGEKLLDGSAIADIIGATASVVAIAIAKNPYQGAMIGNAISRAISSFGKAF